MTLQQKQNEFVRNVVRLLTWIDINGYEVSFGETFRTKEQALLYAKQGKGIQSSLHTLRLAIDLNIFKKGVMLVTYEDMLPIGEFWVSLSVPDLECAWGGHFTDPDCGHFSVEHNGVR